MMLNQRVGQRIICCRVRMPYLGECDWGTLAEVRGDYGAHARYGYEAGYTVTQVSTGLAVCHCGSRKEAVGRMEVKGE